MSKIEAHKFELSYGEFNFEKMLMDIINVTNVRAEEKNLNFAVILNTNVPSLIIGDELRFSQVIMNLLNNAIKFTPENGKVVLRVEKVEESGDEITLKTEIADSGIGMTDEQQKKLFTSYVQADSSITKNFGGTGLGLVISKQIVELMHGEIWIESKPNKGSKFIFTTKVQKGLGKADVQLSAKNKQGRTAYSCGRRFRRNKNVFCPRYGGVPPAVRYRVQRERGAGYDAEVAGQALQPVLCRLADAGHGRH